MCSWELVGRIWDVVNLLVTVVCLLSFSGAGLSGTVGFGNAVGFGRALIALFIDVSGENGVALWPKPCVWRVVVLYFLALALGRFGTVFLCICLISMYAWRLCCVYSGVAPEDSSSDSLDSDS